MNRKRIIGALSAVLLLTCFSSCRGEPPEEEKAPADFILRYEKSGVGGTIYGRKEQIVPEGGCGMPVSVLAEDGFFFAGWSDGESSPVHIAKDLTADTTVTALFPQRTGELPLLSVRTEGKADVTSKETYLPCQLIASDPEDSSLCMTVPARIRGRGNASWNFPKKSYKLKLSEKGDLLGTGGVRAKDWTLISCYGDQSMLRNYAALRLGSMLDGIPWTSGVSFCELWLNGAYLGVYMLCEQVEEAEGRVETDESLNAQTDRDYLLELDAYAGGEPFIDYFQCGGKNYSIKSDVTAEQGRFLAAFLHDADEAVRSGDREKIEAYLDLDSLVDMYLLQEYSKNIDAGWSSLFFQKKAGGVLYCTAPWDFDLAFGNDLRLDNGDAAQLFAAVGRDGFGQNNLWFMALWKQDWFRTLAADRYAELGEILDALEKDVEEAGKKLAPAMERNYARWDMLRIRTHQQPDRVLKNRTYMEHVNDLLQWMRDRRVYLDRAFAPYESGQ